MVAIDHVLSATLVYNGVALGAVPSTTCVFMVMLRHVLVRWHQPFYICFDMIMIHKCTDIVDTKLLYR